MSALLLRIAALGRKAVYWLQAQAIFALLGLIRLLPPAAALAFVGAAARRIGPLMGRHRVAMENLRNAMPELTEAERRAIALDMWENMARLAGEYVFLDDLFDFDPEHPDTGRIEVNGSERFLTLRDDPRPKIFITAHLGNFELLPIAAATFGLNVTAMFRPPNNPYVAARVLGARKTNMGHLVPSKAGAAITLARVLEGGGNVGVLVDQKFHNGLPSTFFDVPCLTNPLVGKLVRQFNCAIYPAYCIRLPGGRFRLTLEDAIEVPRTEDGRVDTRVLAQALNDHVEVWVRANPGQWMWFHKRWQIRHGARSSAAGSAGPVSS